MHVFVGNVRHHENYYVMKPDFDASLLKPSTKTLLKSSSVTVAKFSLLRFAAAVVSQ